MSNMDFRSKVETETVQNSHFFFFVQNYSIGNERERRDYKYIGNRIRGIHIRGSVSDFNASSREQAMCGDARIVSFT